MKDVAKLLGLKFGEKFNIKGVNCDFKYFLSKNGLHYEYENNIYKSSTVSLDSILLGKYQIIKLPKPILDEKEKEYLSAVITPFRNKVICIYKQTSVDCEDERIEIAFNDHSIDMSFPYFKKDAMYKGMETYKEYSLEELGL